MRNPLDRGRLRFHYAGSALSESGYRALADRTGWESTALEIAPGIALKGLLRFPRNPTAPWVLFYQGNGPRLLQGGQDFLETLRAERDWGLAVFAYRGFDSSGGRARLPELAEDAPRMLTQLCALAQVERNRIHLVGFSLGAYFAMRAMADGAAPAAASLTLLAPVNDVVVVPRTFYSRILVGDQYRARPFLDAIASPVLLIQGAADEALHGPGQGRAIATELGTRVRYIELPEVGHTQLLDSPETLRAIRHFIETHCPSETTSKLA